VSLVHAASASATAAGLSRIEVRAELLTPCSAMLWMVGATGCGSAATALTVGVATTTTVASRVRHRPAAIRRAGTRAAGGGTGTARTGKLLPFRRGRDARRVAGQGPGHFAGRTHSAYRRDPNRA